MPRGILDIHILKCRVLAECEVEVVPVYYGYVVYRYVVAYDDKDLPVCINILVIGMLLSDYVKYRQAINCARVECVVVHQRGVSVYGYGIGIRGIECGVIEAHKRTVVQVEGITVFPRRKYGIVDEKTVCRAVDIEAMRPERNSAEPARCEEARVHDGYVDDRVKI